MQGAGCHEVRASRGTDAKGQHGLLSSRALQSLPTLTTMIVALASTLVLTLAGCASSAGIAPTATTELM